jgi:hypothetical protein
MGGSAISVDCVQDSGLQEKEAPGEKGDRWERQENTEDCIVEAHSIHQRNRRMRNEVSRRAASSVKQSQPADAKLN